MGEYVDYMTKSATGPFRGTMGQRMVATFGLLFDAIQQTILDAVLSPWLDETNGPAYDSLRLIGKEQSIPQFPEESWLQYRARLRDPWSTWARAGGPPLIIEQLALGGFPGAQIFRWSAGGSPSEFVVFFPAGSHPVTGPGAAWGSFVWGDGTHYGPTGITPAQIETIRGIIKHWKPAIWVCKKVIFELSGWTYGSGHTWGEPGLVWGGTQAEIGV